MGEFAELNLYRFNYNNAVNFIDPDGLWGVQIGGINFGYGDPTYVFDGVDWDGYWGDVGDTLVGELKGAGSELSFGFYKPCYTSALQRQGGNVGVVLAMAGETLAGYGVAGTAAKGVKGASTAVKEAKEFSHWIPERYIRPSSRSYKPWLDNKLGRDFVNSKWNGNRTSMLDHWLNDNVRGNLAKAARGDAVRNRFLAQQYNRAPLWLKAGAGGSAAAIGGARALTDGADSPCQ